MAAKIGAKWNFAGHKKRSQARARDATWERGEKRAELILRQAQDDGLL